MVKPFENIWLRILAVLVGLLLWFHVATEKEYKYRLDLTVADITLGEGLTMVEAPPDSIAVMVSASGKQLLRRKWRDRGVRITATQLSTGRHSVNLTTANTALVGTGSDVKLEEIVSPTSLSLIIDYEAKTSVRVIPNITTSPAEGFAVSRMSAPEPPEVTIIGARSMIGSISQVSTESRHLTGLRDNLTVALAVLAPEGYAMVVEPDSIQVAIEIVAVRTKVLEGIPIAVFNAPPDLTVSTEPAVLRVELTGPPDEIDLLTGNGVVASVDYRRMDSNSFSAVRVDCPPSFKVKRASPDSVRIRVE